MEKVLTITAPSGGKRRFFTFRDANQVLGNSNLVSKPQPNSNSTLSNTNNNSNENENDQMHLRLLGKTIEDIMSDISNDRADHNTQQVTNNTQTKKSSASKSCSMLWVDKYAPTTFSDLLGDCTTNRAVLKWLTEWRQYLDFKHQQPQGQGPGEAQPQPKLQLERPRPQHSMILISGGPGIGKTTLANVLSQHAGFRAYEINASDLRSAKDLEQRLCQVLSTKSIFSLLAKGSQANLPSCIVLDELDGACGGGEGTNAIDMLLKILHGRTASGKLPGFPIIGLCNDLFAKPLRPLRRDVPVFQYKKPDKSILQSRLAFISRNEALMIDDIVLSHLCAVSGCDIRSALNTLQLLRHDQELAHDVAIFDALGCKDTSVNVFKVWEDLFISDQPANGRKNTKAVKDKKCSSSSSSFKDFQRFQQLCKSIQTVDAETIAAGCYENALQVLGTSDARFDRICESYDYHAFADYCGAKSAYENACLQYALSCSRPKACTGSSTKKWILPSQGHQNREDLEHVQRELEAFLDGIHDSQVKRFMSKQVARLEYASMLLHISNIELSSFSDAPEQASAKHQNLKRAAALLRKYNISIREQRSHQQFGTAQQQWCFDPDIEYLGRIQNSSTIKRHTHNFNLDTTRNKRRRAENCDATAFAGAMPDQVKEKLFQELMIWNDDYQDNKALLHTALDFESPVDNELSVPMSNRANNDKSVPSKQEQEKLSVIFQYHEGHTNAVRRAMYIGDFL